MHARDGTARKLREPRGGSQEKTPRTRGGLALIAAIAAIIMVLVWVAIAEIDRRRARRVRCGVIEYYRLGSWIVAPYNVWAAVNARTAPTPWVSVRRAFPGGLTLQAAWREIAAEAESAMMLAEPVDDEPIFRRIAPRGGRWKRFGIRWYGPISQRARALCPKTCALLDVLPEVRLATFSVLEPGAVVIPHRGPFRGALRYHLGLSVPLDNNDSKHDGDGGEHTDGAGGGPPLGERSYEDNDNNKYRDAPCRLTVDGTSRVWTNGGHLLFDDTYVHEVRNLCDRPRIVLFCDVERPMRTARAQAINAWVCSAFGPLSTRANDRVERESVRNG